MSLTISFSKKLVADFSPSPTFFFFFNPLFLLCGMQTGAPSTFTYPAASGEAQEGGEALTIADDEEAFVFHILRFVLFFSGCLSASLVLPHPCWEGTDSI